MSDELQRSAELIERLLGDPDLRRRFRADPAQVLTEADLPELAAGVGTGAQALTSLELRESRSSLAGVLVAAAAEGVDLAHFAERAAPALAHGAGRALDQIVSAPRHAPSPPATTAGQASAAADPAVAHPAVAHPAVADPAVAHRAVAHPGAPDQAAAHRRAVDQAAARRHAARRAGAHHSGAAAAAAGAPAPEPGTTYPGDQATPQQLAAWMGARARAAGLPPELPVMAALTESGLRNLSYGDRDSVGFFQMRLGIWDEGAYTGYPDHPELQVQWFIDHALAARSEDPALAESPSTWGDWVANVERPAAEYRYRYQLQLSTAQELLRGADLAPSAGTAAPVPVGQSALNEALRLVSHGGGHAGAGPDSGPGAARLVALVYGRHGIQLPPAAAEQFDVGIPIARHQLAPGDAVFFTQAGGYIHHVGLYIGHDRFVSAPDGGGKPTVSSLSAPEYAHTYAGARRYTAAAVSNPASYARPLPTIKP